MAYQDQDPKKPYQDAEPGGTKDGAKTNRPSRTRMASDATGVNPEDSAPIDPRMPNLPPA